MTVVDGCVLGNSRISFEVRGEDESVRVVELCGCGVVELEDAVEECIYAEGAALTSMRFNAAAAKQRQKEQAPSWMRATLSTEERRMASGWRSLFLPIDSCFSANPTRARTA